jgi:tetratricopeptide (TPR) repeat protein
MASLEFDVLLAQMKSCVEGGYYAEAIQVGQKLLTMIPASDHAKCGKIYYNIGLGYNELGRFDEAEESYALSCQECSGDSDTWYNRANNHHRWGTML